MHIKILPITSAIKVTWKVMFTNATALYHDMGSEALIVTHFLPKLVIPQSFFTKTCNATVTFYKNLNLYLLL